ncbi:mannitol dehydrogenase family protein [Streptomyces chartreusis]|uniref:mannitol dehydrogenase family protein n=1 Tax=Streptomyces chartreusis TaxID=1969 RepID=UPI003660D437
MMLSRSTLSHIAERGDVAVPPYDRSGLATGIVHFGVGNFHRAHQALVIDQLLTLGLARDFAICGVGVLAGDVAMRDVMKAQDGLYLLETRHPDGSSEPRILGSVIDYLFAPDDPAAVITKLASPEVRIVSLTVTEGGYNVDQTTGEFNAETKDVQHDLTHPCAPKTWFGLIVAGLQQRKERGLEPFTVMSCDNIVSNGYTARSVVCAFAGLQDPDLAEWIGEHVAFPNSMVDRITPATTRADRERIFVEHGVDDGWPVTTEPFLQWAIEDTFSYGRPPFEEAGVQVITNVAPYELMKLRLLNIGHQALAYFGYLAGYRYVHEAMADEDLRVMLRAYMDDEGTPSLPELPGIDLDAYKDTLIERFSNPEIRDTCARLCAHASDRIPKWLVPVIRENLAAGRDIQISAAICASWARYAEGIDEQGTPYQIIDRLAEERQLAASRQRTLSTTFLENTSLFGDLAANETFVEAYTTALASLHTVGSRRTYRALVQRRPHWNEHSPSRDVAD